MTFAPTGLTVVYGDNGSGRPGYARLIRTPWAPYCEPVNAKVFADGAVQPQKAEIGSLSAGTEMSAS